MKRSRYLIDTNIALDLVLEREPFVADVLHIFALAEASKIELLLSSDAVSTICYIVEKNKNANAARQAMALLLDFVTLAPIDERVVLRGLALDFADIEDALVASAADNARAKAIITRDGKGFAASPVPALNPREFLAIRTSQR